MTNNEKENMIKLSTEHVENTVAYKFTRKRGSDIKQDDIVIHKGQRVILHIKINEELRFTKFDEDNNAAIIITGNSKQAGTIFLIEENDEYSVLESPKNIETAFQTEYYPRILDLYGIAPNCTNGLSSEEFIRQNREKMDEEIKQALGHEPSVEEYMKYLTKKHKSINKD